MRTLFKVLFSGTALVVMAFGLAAGPASAAQTSTTAPSYCRVFDPRFEWESGQERSLRATERPCDAAPGRRAWLVLQTNGNLAFYLDGQQLWSSDTKGRGNKLVERSYGGLDIVGSQGQVEWSTGAPGASGFQPHPNGGFGIGFTIEGEGNGNAFDHWTQDEGLCGSEGGCGETLWISGKGTT